MSRSFRDALRAVPIKPSGLFVVELTARRSETAAAMPAPRQDCEDIFASWCHREEKYESEPR